MEEEENILTWLEEKWEMIFRIEEMNRRKQKYRQFVDVI